MKILAMQFCTVFILISLANSSFAQSTSSKLIGDWVVDIEATTEAYKKMGFSENEIRVNIQALQYTGVHRFTDDGKFEVELKIGEVRKLEGSYAVTEVEKDVLSLSLNSDDTIRAGVKNEIRAKFVGDRLFWNPDTKTAMIFKRKDNGKGEKEKGDDGKDKPNAAASPKKLSPQSVEE